LAEAPHWATGTMKLELLRAPSVTLLSCVIFGAGFGFLAGRGVGERAVKDLAGVFALFQGEVAGLRFGKAANKPRKGPSTAHHAQPPTSTAQHVHGPTTTTRQGSKPAAHAPSAQPKHVAPCSGGAKAKIPPFACKVLALRTKTMFKRHVSKDRFRFLHIDKTGGSTIETLLRIGFTGHQPLINRDQIKTHHWITILRDPIERAASSYYFRISGRSTVHFKERQALICKAGTGKAYHKRCIPKMGLYEYSLKHTEVNHQWQMVATDAKKTCTTATIWIQLLAHFWIVGTTSRLKEVMVILVKVFHLPQLKFDGSTHRKQMHYPRYNETLDQRQIESLRRTFNCDSRLYTTGQRFLDQLVNDFGVGRMAEELKRATAAR